MLLVEDAGCIDLALLLCRVVALGTVLANLEDIAVLLSYRCPAKLLPTEVARSIPVLVKSQLINSNSKWNSLDKHLQACA